MEKLEGKKVLLTGGSRGIGPIIAEYLADQGSIVGIAARSKNKLQEIASRLNKKGYPVEAFTVDLKDSSQREELVAGFLKKFGTIDILINNAGLETEGAYTELSWASIRENIEVNLVAPMALTHLVLPVMLNNKAGHVVNIASIAAKSGAPYAAVYSGTKAGLAEWSRALRLELTGTGVHFSTIFPGYVREVGMFARFGMDPPWLVGSCSPHQAANSVIDAIINTRKEIIVNSKPLRYSFMINDLSPRFGDWLMQISGLVDFQRRKVAKQCPP
jgi:short-subunit dehydrogenase